MYAIIADDASVRALALGMGLRYGGVNDVARDMQGFRKLRGMMFGLLVGVVLMTLGGLSIHAVYDRLGPFDLNPSGLLRLRRILRDEDHAGDRQRLYTGLALFALGVVIFLISI